MFMEEFSSGRYWIFDYGDVVFTVHKISLTVNVMSEKVDNLIPYCRRFLKEVWNTVKSEELLVIVSNNKMKSLVKYFGFKYKGVFDGRPVYVLRRI